ncbi:hypothetical protein FHT60_004413, partial [Novosphingobium sp. BK486]|nr:hypothetical protein [Novosphingobium sp. BK256]MBB3376943.1 hypothetical protein [Novosphingobium sp. BK280]MBB3381325.1 hypothetical protein [Novosphingobium sp. BK258]MBB3423003.1 hypothetical protein [Novosphingobium sp. BK267]MBB3451706.1 hypothetical protein [Novosphingobium sp. BK352]MBB3480223.1 hypothetical protein [Novosphingobium sp. BK369]MBB3503540.1 hypothetical protein [Novosphingobium sp. BK336]MBB3539284.1 hypothetical protein [Novosphingobium sp. BK486]MBB3558667.1 hypo
MKVQRHNALEDLYGVATGCLNRPGFSGGSFNRVMQPYRGSQVLHSNWLRPR